MSPYSASKAGVIGLVKSAGKEYATSGKVNVTLYIPLKQFTWLKATVSINCRHY